MKKILVAACLVVLGVALAQAGDKSAAAGADKMAAAKAEMEKCAVCKVMAPHMDEFGPVMTMEVVNLNDGVALMHGVSDPKLVDKFHAVGAEMMKAGEATASMTPEQAKAGLCSFCYEINSVMGAGAKMSYGDTKTGDVMILTSSDAAMLQRLQALGAQCAAMAASM
jgi:hypothetical protein